jgi:hypothetical protein
MYAILRIDPLYLELRIQGETREVTQELIAARRGGYRDSVSFVAIRDYSAEFSRSILVASSREIGSGGIALAARSQSHVKYLLFSTCASRCR